MDEPDLKQIATLGAVAEAMEKEEIQEAAAQAQYAKKLFAASVQLDAAHMCVQKALDILETIPNMGGGMFSVMLRMVAVQLVNYMTMLRKETQK